MQRYYRPFHRNGREDGNRVAHLHHSQHVIFHRTAHCGIRVPNIDEVARSADIFCCVVGLVHEFGDLRDGEVTEGVLHSYINKENGDKVNGGGRTRKVSMCVPPGPWRPV